MPIWERVQTALGECELFTTRKGRGPLAECELQQHVEDLNAAVKVRVQEAWLDVGQTEMEQALSRGRADALG